ncbi:hypothetical protein [uncultured Deinococcus sp.]|uniref:hypothetical protein n=1 Tax=uncultured Deinococcus sp. TaxID=158789 RepID=UPI00258D3367|nr:hypothetical protein [uncultured Deinococcus sp.]
MTKTRAKPAKKSASKPAADVDASADKAAPPKSTELKVRRPHAPARAQPGDPLGAALEAQGFTVQDEPGLGRRFAFEGGTYYLVSAEGDETFYHLLYPNFWELESDEEYVRALYACDAVNREAKLVKLHTAENDVWAGVESLHETPAAFAAQVPRYLSYLQESVRAFRDVMLAAAEDLAEAGA